MTFEIGQRILSNTGDVGTVLWIGSLAKNIAIGLKPKKIYHSTVSNNNNDNVLEEFDHTGRYTPISTLNSDTISRSTVDGIKGKACSSEGGLTSFYAHSRRSPLNEGIMTMVLDTMSDSENGDGVDPEYKSRGSFVILPGTVNALGIEWDDYRLGDNDGTIVDVDCFRPERVELIDRVKMSLVGAYSDHKDKRLMERVTTDDLEGLYITSNTPCSFISEDEVNVGISLQEAITERYLDAGVVNQKIVDGDFSAEFVGCEEALDFFSQTANLFTIGLNSFKISTIGDCSKFSFPKVKEVYLSDNLFYKWETISEILRIFPKVQTLDLSRNLLKLEPGLKPTQGYLYNLVLNSTRIPFKDVTTLVKDLKLNSLSLCSNFYTDLDITTPLENLTSLDLSYNYIWNWYSVFKCIANLKDLKRLLLNNNRLSDVYKPTVRTEDTEHTDNSGSALLYYGAISVADLSVYSRIEELHLNDNYIYDWETINVLSYLFKNLKVLRLSLFSVNSEPIPNVHRQILISVFSNLRVLNGSDVTETERVNAERYYLMLSTGNGEIYKATSKNYGTAPTHKARLEVVHGVREETKGQRIETLTSRLIKLHLVPDADSDSFTKDPVDKKIPATATVRDLKMICTKLFDIRLTDIILVYNDGKMPLCERLEDDSAELQQYGIQDGYHIRVQSKLHQV